VPGDVDQIPAGMVAGADYVVDLEVAYYSASLQALPRAGRQGVGGDLPVWDRNGAGWFLAGAAERVGHRGLGVALDLSRMANLAATGALRLLRHGCRLRLRASGAAGWRLRESGIREADQQNEGRQISDFSFPHKSLVNQTNV
jgi:hypothetical protein